MDDFTKRLYLIRPYEGSNSFDKLCAVIAITNMIICAVVAIPLHDLNNTQSAKLRDITISKNNTGNLSPPRITTNIEQVYTDKCHQRRSCRATIRSRLLDSEPKKQSCTCDQACRS